MLSVLGSSRYLVSAKMQKTHRGADSERTLITVVRGNGFTAQSVSHGQSHLCWPAGKYNRNLLLASERIHNSANVKPTLQRTVRQSSASLLTVGACRLSSYSPASISGATRSVTRPRIGNLPAARKATRTRPLTWNGWRKYSNPPQESVLMADHGS